MHTSAEPRFTVDKPAFQKKKIPHWVKKSYLTPAIGLIAVLVGTAGLVGGFKYFRGDFRGQAAVEAQPVTLTLTVPKTTGVNDMVNQNGNNLSSVPSSTVKTNWIGTSTSLASSYLGLRFSGLTGGLLNDYQIDKAYLELVPSETSATTGTTSAFNVSVYAEKSLAPLPFNSTNKISATTRILTSARADHAAIASQKWTKDVPVRLDVSAPVKEAVTSTNQQQVALIIKGTSSIASRNRKFHNNYNTTRTPKLILELKLKPGKTPTSSIKHTMNLASVPTRYFSDVVSEYNKKVTFPSSTAQTTLIGSFGTIYNASFTAFRFSGMEADLANYNIVSGALKLTPNASTTTPNKTPINVSIFLETSTAPESFTATVGYADPTSTTPITKLEPDVDDGFSSIGTFAEASQFPAFSSSSLPSGRQKTVASSLYTRTNTTADQWTNVAVELPIAKAVFDEGLGGEAASEVGIIVKGNEAKSASRRFYNDQNATKAPKLKLVLQPKSGGATITKEYSLARKTYLGTDVINQDNNTISPTGTTTKTNWIGTGNNASISYLGMRFCCKPVTPTNYIFKSAKLVLTPSVTYSSTTSPISVDIYGEKNADPEFFSKLYSLPAIKFANLANLTAAKRYPTNATTELKWTKDIPVEIDITAQYTAGFINSSQERLAVLVKGLGTAGRRRNFHNGASKLFPPKLVVEFIPNVPAPVVTFTADSTSVANNTTTTLRWSTQYAATCAATGAWAGSKAIPTGTESTGNLTSAKTYTLTCANASGSTAKSVTVNVQQPPLTVNLSAADTNISSGQSTTLSWATTSATTCTAYGAWSGTKGVSGSQSTGTLTATKTYTLTCSNASGSQISDSVTVNVNVAPPVSAKKINVLVVRYTDTNPTAAYTNFLDQSMRDWEAQMENGSRYHGTAQPIVDVIIKGVITRNQRTPNLGNPDTSLNAMLTANNNEICNRISADQIDQVWHYQTPLNGDDDRDGTVETGEGVGGYNRESTWSKKYEGGLCGGQRSFVHLTANGNMEAPTSLHTFGHFMEALLDTYQGTDLFTQRFAGVGYSGENYVQQPPFNQTPTRGCGNIHWAPNATGTNDNYDYYLNKSTNTNNNCRNWKPDGSGGTGAYGSEAWGCTSTSCADSSYYNWWFNNMPSINSNIVYDKDGTGPLPAKTIPPWFEFLSDMDNTLKYYASRSDQWHMNTNWIQSYYPDLLLPDYIDKVSSTPSHPASKTFTLQHNSTGSNKLLLVAVGYGSLDVADEAQRRVQSVSVAPTSGGTSTALTRANKSTFQNAKNVEWWYMSNPPTSATITVTMATSTYTDVAASAISVNNAISPVIGSASALGGSGVYQPGQTAYSLNIPSANGDVALFAFATYSNGGANFISHGADITKVAEAVKTGNTVLYIGAKRSTSTTTPVSWSTNQSWFWASAGVSINR